MIFLFHTDNLLLLILLIHVVVDSLIRKDMQLQSPRK